MKKITALLLVVLMLAQLASCGSGTNEDATTPSDTTNTDIAANTETETETEAKPNLPEKDYGGQVLHILAETDFEKFVFASELTGEAVNDALYNARTAVEEQFNVSFVIDIVVAQCDTKTTDNTIKSGEDAFLFAQNHDRTTATMSLNGWFYDFHELPYIDLTAEWWPHFTVDSLTINHQMYFTSCFINWNGLAQTRVIFANMDLLNNFKLANPFEMVYNKTWTLDNFTTMIKDVYVDVDGNGVCDKTDTYGFFFEYDPYCWLEGFGVEIYKKEGADSPIITLDALGDRTATLVDKLHTLGYSGLPGTFVTLGSNKENTNQCELFSKGNAVFGLAGIDAMLTYLTDSDIDYAMLPLPLFDENQSDYIGPCTDRLIYVPITVQDTEQAGILLEALEYQGYKLVMPTYQESTLKKRYANSEDTAKMLDIVFSNRVISLSYLYGNMSLNLLKTVVPDNTLVSYVESESTKEQKYIDQVIALHSSDKTK